MVAPEQSQSDDSSEEEQAKPSLLRRVASNIFSRNTFYLGLAAAAAGVGIAAIATGAVVGAPNIALAATTIAFEGYSMTPSYEAVAKSRVGRVFTKAVRSIFNRTSLRVFRAVMIGVTIATASGALAGAPIIALGAVNAAGIAYNMYREIHELRKSRRLCKQEQNLRKFKQFSKVKEQAIAQEPELTKVLGLDEKTKAKAALPEPVGDISKTLKAKLFLRKLVDSLAESASGLVEAVANFAASPVAGIVTICALVGIGDAAKVEYRAKKRNKQLRAELASEGYDPRNKKTSQELEANAIEAEATVMAMAHVKQQMKERGLSLTQDKDEIKKIFDGHKASSIEDIQQRNAVMNPPRSAFKDLVSLHTSPHNDPMDVTYERHDANLAKLDQQILHARNTLGIKSATTTDRTQTTPSSPDNPEQAMQEMTREKNAARAAHATAAGHTQATPSQDAKRMVASMRNKTPIHVSRTIPTGGRAKNRGTSMGGIGG